ncbi:MAG: divergent polysaccharide deacetylase family protein [Gammaproteobacteria bacterium]|nr:divergent polysaccharide deacetylase family protein [Gammaproteobacteria bacterium]
MHSYSFIKKAGTLLVLAFFIGFNFSANATSFLSLIIDDIGHNYNDGNTALSLPGKITYALLPYSAHATALSAIGLKNNKEFILHSPMQSIDNRLITRHTLHIHMSEQQFTQQFHAQLDQFPFIKGINNHMGSLLTRHPGYMDLLMRELKDNRNLFFLDSRTSERSVALQIASEHDVPTLKRDVFLDNDPSLQAINRQLDQAIRIAKTNGYAVVIGHPYPSTLNVLQKRLPELEKSDIKLITASSLITKLQEHDNEKSTDTARSGLRGTRSRHPYRLAQKSRH